MPNYKLFGKTCYSFSFVINVNYCDQTLYDRVLAFNIEDAIDKLPNAIVKRISCLACYTRNIILYNKDNEQLRKFYSYEELVQESTKA